MGAGDACSKLKKEFTLYTELSFFFKIESKFLLSTLLHSEWPKLHRVLAILSAIGLRCAPTGEWINGFANTSIYSAGVVCFAKIAGKIIVVYPFISKLTMDIISLAKVELQIR